MFKFPCLRFSLPYPRKSVISESICILENMLQALLQSLESYVVIVPSLREEFSREDFDNIADISVPVRKSDKLLVSVHRRIR
jgi:hypothetical protein